jgi:hypothetical protein
MWKYFNNMDNNELVQLKWQSLGRSTVVLQTPNGVVGKVTSTDFVTSVMTTDGWLPVATREAGGNAGKSVTSYYKNKSRSAKLSKFSI